ncbi:MAG: hypothetical protein ABIR30_15140 [Chitinophagaceae bacterium]
MIPGKKTSKPQPIGRRHFVGTSLKFITLGTLLGPVIESCNNKKSTEQSSKSTDSTNTKKNQAHSKKSRKKWGHESLVVNTKSNIMHLPSAQVYHYYDEIKSSHVSDVGMSNWFSRLQEPVRLNKEQSGNIIEILTLQGLKGTITDTALVIAIDTLSMAFTNLYEKANTLNFRLHELMLQLVALNNSIPSSEKWITFSSKVKKPVQLRKRQKWMETETAFNERVSYILTRQNDYIVRLSKRAAKYSFT